MFCPQCGAEYRTGFSRCSDCDVALVRTRPKTDAANGDDTNEIVVFMASDMIEAESVKGLLESGGIEVFLVGESSPLPGIPGAVEVVVREDQAEMAHELIEEYSEDAANARGYVVPFPSSDSEDEGS